MKGSWAAHDVRDEVVDYVRYWSKKAALPVRQLVAWLGLGRGKYYNWRERYGKVNEHNAWIPRDHWLLDDEKQAIVSFADAHPLEGYRRLTYMLMDDDVVAASPSSVYRVLKQAGLLRRWNGKTSKKGTGFHPPLKSHQHWHIDISYLNVCGTFYYLCSVLDGFSRYIVHWEIRRRRIATFQVTHLHEEIKATRRVADFFRKARSADDVEADSQNPTFCNGRMKNFRKRRRGSCGFCESVGNGPAMRSIAFIAKDFKTFIRLMGMTHVKTSPFYPQSADLESP